ncbi:MAG: hypothetical protein ACJ72D_26550 [Marmoricola sp.]
MLRLPRGSAALPVVLALEVVTSVSQGTPWVGEWNWTLDYAIGSTVLTGPLVAGVAGWLAAAERDRADLNDSTPRSWLVPARAAGSAATVGLLGWVVGLVLALLATASVRHGGPVAAAVLLLVPLLLAFYAALGATVGHLVPVRVVVVLVPVAAFVLGSLSLWGLGPNVLRQGPTTGTLAGLTWDVRVVLAQAAVLGGAVVALLAGVASRGLRRRPRVLVPLVTGAALVVGGLASLEAHGSESFVASGERATACTSTVPAVCVAPSNRRALDAVGREVARAAEVLRAAGAALPSSYVAEVARAPRQPGAGFFALGPEANRTDFSVFDAAHAVTMPAPCPAWFAERPPPEVAFVARELIAAWVLGRLGKDAPDAVPGAAAWRRATPASQQAAWVVHTFAQLRSCDLGTIRLPWRPAG